MQSVEAMIQPSYKGPADWFFTESGQNAWVEAMEVRPVKCCMYNLASSSGADHGGIGRMEAADQGRYDAIMTLYLVMQLFVTRPALALAK